MGNTGHKIILNGSVQVPSHFLSNIAVVPLTCSVYGETDDVINTLIPKWAILPVFWESRRDANPQWQCRRVPRVEILYNLSTRRSTAFPVVLVELSWVGEEVVDGPHKGLLSENPDGRTIRRPGAKSLPTPQGPP